MSILPRMFMHRTGSVMAAICAIAVMAGCASGPDKPQPTELGPNAALINIRLAWSARIGPVALPLETKAQGGSVTLASSDGTVAALDGANGQDLWRASLGVPIGAGVGTDGRHAAVITRANQLVVMERGREVWRENLSALAHTAPLVAGARVFVATADRTVTAFDAASGIGFWHQSNLMPKTNATGTTHVRANRALHCARRVCCCLLVTRWLPAWRDDWSG